MFCSEQTQYAAPTPVSVFELSVEMRVPVVMASPSSKKSVLLWNIQRNVFPLFNLSRLESCQRVQKGDVQSANGCDSDLLLQLEVERRNSKYDLERQGCCGSVYS
ncbi:hypothetical protein AVEN_25802-1 [Araneus ventricosus]|uniref:Uncharacterized protein n=1 Tax=Araneus ventricosus TaxID=182803 RepID=A0A4Y2LJJ5_ARAVE|nr:hypothetical protein AVEN_25802-1 [Araneus ventricosus]